MFHMHIHSYYCSELLINCADWCEQRGGPHSTPQIGWLISTAQMVLSLAYLHQNTPLCNYLFTGFLKPYDSEKPFI